MGNNRNLTLLVAVLVVLGGLYLFSRGHRSHIDNTGGYVDLVEGPLSTDDVFSMSVSVGDSTLELAKDSGNWVVRSRLDAPATPEGILRSVEDLRVRLDAAGGGAPPPRTQSTGITAAP